MKFFKWGGWGRGGKAGTKAPDAHLSIRLIPKSKMIRKPNKAQKIYQNILILTINTFIIMDYSVLLNLDL